MKRALVILGAALLAIAVIWHPPAPAPIAVSSTPGPARTPRPVRATPSREPAVVYVAGAVLHPGLYRVTATARADDALRQAGGFARDADRAAVNLAQHVRDGDEIRVPALGAPITRTRASTVHSRRPTASKKQTAPVDVNRADAATLATVPGIGAALAARIVEVRERDGSFDTLDQLLDVAGMTPARLDRASAYLHI